MNDSTASPKRRDRSSLRYDIPSEDMMRACKSLLRQIDWSRVALDVAKGETSITYRAALQEVLQEQIEGVLVEACNETARDIEHCRDSEEADDTDSDTESGETESDEESYEHSFVDSDENEGESAEYQASDDSVDVGEDEVCVKDRTDVCAFCRKTIVDPA